MDEKYEYGGLMTTTTPARELALGSLIEQEKEALDYLEKSLIELYNLLSPVLKVPQSVPSPGVLMDGTSSASNSSFVSMLDDLLDKTNKLRGTVSEIKDRLQL